MSSAQIRARGQAAVFAGIWLFAFIPFFQYGALQSTGYGSAAQASAQGQNFAPILLWALGHPALVVIFPLLEALPLIIVLSLPVTLQRVVFGNEREGRVGRWCGLAGLLLTVVVTLLDMGIFLATSRQFAGAQAATRAAIGANFRATAIMESLIVDILGFLLIAIWQVSVSMPLARLEGLERLAGFAGIASAAVLLATGGLVLFNPQQSQGALSGTALALFGVWLAILGYVLWQRASALGAPLEDAMPEPDAAPAVPVE